MTFSGHAIRHLGLQVLRRCVQLSVLGVLVGMVYLSLYAHYRAANALDDETEFTGARRAVLLAFDERIEKLDDPQAFLDDNKGTIWSMRIGGVDLTDPLAAAEATAATRSIHWPLLSSILIPVLLSLALGKVFCSFVCPASLLFEVAGKLRKLLRLAELPAADVKFSRGNKYVFLAAGLLVAAVVGLPLFALVYPPAALSRLIHAWVFGTPLTGIAVLLGLIIVVEVLISPRWWCRVMCPGGALYGLIGWPRLLRVKLDTGRCTHCRECIRVCEPGLDPVGESYGIECDNCGECVKVCPDRALGFTVGLPIIGRKPPADEEHTAEHQAAAAKATVALMALAITVSIPPQAEAHHILGLPHYSYKENYPQAPVLEYPAKTGPYDVLFVCYPGKPAPGEPANLVFDIKNGSTGARYRQPVSVRVLQTFTFGENREILPATTVPAYDVLFKLSSTFPDDGEYVVELTLDVEGKPEVIGFLLVAGDPGATASIVIALAAGLAVFLITVRAVKKKRDRALKKRGVEAIPCAT